MKKTSLIAVLIFAMAFVGVAGAGVLNIIKASGRVNLQEIGGSGLYVFSLWDTNKGPLVAADGSFTTLISDSGLQKISVKDNKHMTRALAIVFPNKSEQIDFDAKSTAMALMFRDPNLLRNPAKAEGLTAAIVNKDSFRRLVAFLKNNLPNKSLEELTDDPECIALLEKCNKEIFGEDQQAIQKSLNQAENKLRKLLQEN